MSQEHLHDGWEGFSSQDLVVAMDAIALAVYRCIIVLTPIR